MSSVDGIGMPDDPNASFTVDLGKEQGVDKIEVWNDTLTKNLIVGCELQVLDDKENVLRKWAFADVDEKNGLLAYVVSAETDFKLTRLDG